MIFARKVWKLLVAVKDGLVLLLLLLFFLMLYAALTARPTAGSIRDGALLLKFDGAIVEEPAVQDPFTQLLSNDAPAAEYRARDVVRALRLAAKDKRVKAVVFDLSRFTGAGMVHLQDIGAAIDEVRAAKKPVLTYATAYVDDGLMIAAHASEAWVDPLGGAFVMGPGGNRLYYARLLEKFKVTAHVFRVGAFKSAVEPYLRSDASPEARQADQALYDALWTAWKADVMKARPKADLSLVSTDPAAWLRASGGDAAKAAQAIGLVDRVGDRVDFGKRVAEIAGQGEADAGPGAFAHTSLKTWLANNPEQTSGKAIGVVTIAGTIVDGKQGPGTAGGDRIAALLDKALKEDFAALVVRVDSPGGSVMASEQIRKAIERHKAKGVPVVVSMANMAASGGYWVSTPATRIFAEPATLTGSIGIFAVLPSFERALGDLGVNGDGIKTTPISGQPDVLTGLSPQVSDMLQANIENGYYRFLDLVGRSRGKTREQVDAVAQGRVWDGGTARQNGLVDQFGGLDDALAYAAGAAKLQPGAWRAVYLGESVDPYQTILERLRGDDDSAPPAQGRDWAALAADRQFAVLSAAVADAQRMVAARGMQAYCLECPARAPARPLDPAAKLGFLARIAGFLGGG